MASLGLELGILIGTLRFAEDDTNQEPSIDTTGIGRMHMMRRTIAIALISVFAGPALADDDRVIFNNGDRLTGEVRSLEKGLLRFKTGAAGTVRIEWDEVAYVTSTQNIQVETEEGLRFLGSLGRSAEPAMVTIETAAGNFEIEAERVVGMEPIQETVVGRFDGDVMAGYDFTKATDLKQFNLSLDMQYRTEFRIFSLESNASSSDSGTADSSQRHNVNFTYRRLRENRWIYSGLAKIERNDQLGIDMRTSVGAGIGRILQHTNSVNLLLEGGVITNRENISSGLDTENNWEAYASLRWDWFRYDLPELDLSSSMMVFPNLSDSGRVRTEFEIDFRWEFIDDFFWSLSYWNSRDNRPTDPSASEIDYGVNTSLGWDF
jgi:putative salt-induced outer membrane protein YdiY